MVISAEVRNSSGQLLLKRGSVLSERHLAIFESWNIESVRVEGNIGNEKPSSDEFDISVAQLKEITLEVEHRFQHVTSKHPAVDVLKTLCVRSKANHKKQGTP